jgi:hypothetical protein
LSAYSNFGELRVELLLAKYEKHDFWGDFSLRRTSAVGAYQGLVPKKHRALCTAGKPFLCAKEQLFFLVCLIL